MRIKPDEVLGAGHVPPGEVDWEWHSVRPEVIASRSWRALALAVAIQYEGSDTDTIIALTFRPYKFGCTYRFGCSISVAPVYLRVFF